MDIMEVKNTMLENMETLLQESAKEALIRWLQQELKEQHGIELIIQDDSHLLKGNHA